MDQCRPRKINIEGLLRCLTQKDTGIKQKNNHVEKYGTQSRLKFSVRLYFAYIFLIFEIVSIHLQRLFTLVVLFSII